MDINKCVTTGDIAKELGMQLDQIKYAIRRLNLLPLGRVGNSRIFDRSAIQEVQKYVKESGAFNT